MVEHTVAAPSGEPAAPGSPAWLALRRTGIGGSDAAAALALSPWRSPFELYLDKLGELPEREPTPAMQWGALLEPLILQGYADATHRRIARPRTTFRSERYPWMLANLDGLADGRIVEAKTARTAEGWGEQGSDEIPLTYLLQVQHYMVVVALPVADVAALIGGSDLRIYEVPADRELQEMVIDREADFWARVQRREPPEVRDVNDVRLRYGALPVKGTVTATPDDVARHARLLETSGLLKQLVSAAEGDKAALMQRLGDAGDVLVDAQGKPLVSWKLARAAMRFDAEAFAAEHPELFESYLRPGKAARRFLLKGSTEEV